MSGHNAAHSRAFRRTRTLRSFPRTLTVSPGVENSTQPGGGAQCVFAERRNEWVDEWLGSCAALLATSWLWSPGLVLLLAAFLLAVRTWLAFSYL